MSRRGQQWFHRRPAHARCDRELEVRHTNRRRATRARGATRAVNAILIKARTAVHKFDSDPVVAAANEGLALCGTTKKIAAEAIEEAKTRRRNLLLPLAVIAVLMVALALKLRQLERG
jgi:hypothetical protein